MIEMTKSRWESLEKTFKEHHHADFDDPNFKIAILTEGPVVIAKGDGPILLIRPEHVESWDKYSSERWTKIEPHPSTRC